MVKSDLPYLLDEWIELQRKDEISKKSLRDYRSNVQRFIDWLPDDKEIDKDLLMQFKEECLGQQLSTVSSINTNITEVNAFIKYIGLQECCLKRLRSQIKSSNEEVITLADFNRLIKFARKRGDVKTEYIMQVLVRSGIRISELKYFTVENLNANKNAIRVFNKNKERKIIISTDLRKMLKKYCRDQKISSGYIFRSDVYKDKLVSQSTIKRHMKSLAGAAKVKKSKVHPHSFRHLFAQIYLETFPSNYLELSDALGHTNVNTTKIYTQNSEEQKRVNFDKMKF